ncbi:hypothetical protein MHF_1131 [Mycoplasma haemofelis Ohio2]|uniref:Uncharacterized protein n=1 Tax=Mycoplasma haemofelis (strain Ohio2) TaxID=859194 RepID=F6FJL9_MYCHI|nr:hypothetical protein MHF_1131 [Mycoplasma haemofelis Ohio2]
MSYLLKAVTLGGIGAAGGGVAFGSSLISGFESKTPKTAKTKEKEPEASTPEAPKPETTCVIYEAKKPENNEFKKLLKKFEGVEAFFAEIVKRPSNTNNEATVKSEVSNACENTGTQRNVKGNVYVWYETSTSGNKWVYSTTMHTGNIDWVNKDGITKSFETVGTQGAEG